MLSRFFLLFILSSGLSIQALTLMPKVGTVFPIFAGAGVGIVAWDSLELSVSYGVTPTPYYRTIGDVVARLANNEAYDDVVEAAFQNNSLIRINMNYYFGSLEQGWRLGCAFTRLSSQGTAGIDEVLEAGTGEDYSSLKALLIAAGKSEYLDIESEFYFIEISAGYSWKLAKKLSLLLQLGVTEIVSSDIGLTAGLPSFENTPAGQRLIGSTEMELESIITRYGISPTLELSLSYFF